VEETGKLVIFGILKSFHLLKNKEHGWLARPHRPLSRSPAQGIGQKAEGQQRKQELVLFLL